MLAQFGTQAGPVELLPHDVRTDALAPPPASPSSPPHLFVAPSPAPLHSPPSTLCALTILFLPAGHLRKSRGPPLVQKCMLQSEAAVLMWGAEPGLGGLLFLELLLLLLQSCATCAEDGSPVVRLERIFAGSRWSVLEMGKGKQGLGAEELLLLGQAPPTWFSGSLRKHVTRG